MAEEQPQESLTPYWVCETEFIHPALDFKNGVAYVAQWLPVNSVKLERACFVITAGPERGLKPSISSLQDYAGEKFIVVPGDLKNRWSMQAMKNFCNGLGAEVKLKQTYEAMLSEYKYYMDFEHEEEYNLLALWTLGTYFFPLFSAYPYIFLNATKRAGKTKCLTISSCMGFNAKPTLCLTSATLFRLIHNNRCALFIDETEKMHKRDENDLRSMLLAGYKRGMLVPRAEEKGGKKGHYEIREYEVYGPKMLANIAGIEDVLEDRCISLTLRRTLDKKIANRLPNIEDEKWQKIRDLAYFSLFSEFPKIITINGIFNEGKGESGDIGDEKKEIRDISPTIIEGANHVCRINHYTITQFTQNILHNYPKLSSRFLELWQPILVLALAVDETGELAQKMVEFASKKVDEKTASDIVGETDMAIIELLLDLVIKDDWYSVKSIKETLLAQEPELKDWLTSQWLGRALGRIGLKEKRIIHGRKEWFIRRSDIEKIALRMGIEAKKDEKDGEKTPPKDSEPQKTLAESAEPPPLSPALEIVRSICSELSGNFSAPIPPKDIFERAGRQGLSVEQANVALEYMRREGELYQPEPGKWKLVRKEGGGEL